MAKHKPDLWVTVVDGNKKPKPRVKPPLRSCAKCGSQKRTWADYFICDGCIERMRKRAEGLLRNKPEMSKEIPF